MKRLIIMRGLPGSGKTTVADLFGPHHHISMDMYWTKDGQPYEFDYSKLSQAISWVQSRFLEALHEPMIDLVVIDNVNYARQHFQFFVDTAEERGIPVHYVHVERELDDLVNSHGVPEDKVFQMAEKWEHIL